MMSKEKAAQIQAKLKRLADEAEKEMSAAESFVEPFADKIAFRLYTSAHTGRWMLGAFAAVYVAGAHYGFPTWSQVLEILTAGIL